LENDSSQTRTMSPGATSEQQNEQKNHITKMGNRITKMGNRITKTVHWKPDVDDGWTLVKHKKRSQRKIESNQSIVNS
jgi:hypothetical protein